MRVVTETRRPGAILNYPRHSMSTSYSEDQLNIGCHRKGRILVCHGDDEPDEFAAWLQPLVRDFQEISSIADEWDVPLRPRDGSSPINDVTDFCERIGIDFDSNMWEGSMISGIYRIGWIPRGTARRTSVEGRKLLQALRKDTEVAVRAAVLRQLEGIKDLDELLDRTANDGPALRRKIANLSDALNEAQCAAREANEKLQMAQEAGSSQIDRACLELALALLSKERRRVIAGPLALWDDGVIYAICSWGGVSIPEGASPAVLLSGVEEAGRRVVRVRDQTVIGGGLSGPIYSRGPDNISGWINVWSRREKRERTFVVDPPEFSEQVKQIHEALASGRG